MSRRRIGQETFGFAVGRTMGSSLGMRRLRPIDFTISATGKATSGPDVSSPDSI